MSNFVKDDLCLLFKIRSKSNSKTIIPSKRKQNEVDKNDLEEEGICSFPLSKRKKEEEEEEIDIKTYKTNTAKKKNINDNESINNAYSKSNVPISKKHNEIEDNNNSNTNNIPSLVNREMYNYINSNTNARNNIIMNLSKKEEEAMWNTYSTNNFPDIQNLIEEDTNANRINSNFIIPAFKPVLGNKTNTNSQSNTSNCKQL
jgi:hypothetical protein